MHKGYANKSKDEKIEKNQKMSWKRSNAMYVRDSATLKSTQDRALHEPAEEDWAQCNTISFVFY